MRDAKLLVLGNGRVGKTQLCNRLLGAGFEDNADSTHGIVVQGFDLAGEAGTEPARIQLWDFGGQDIYHSTHTLFLRSRGIYLVAWTPAQEDNDLHRQGGQEFRNYRLPYWLGQVAEFGGRSAPLIVVQTQVDGLADKRPLDPAARERFATFATAFEVHHSAKKPRGLEELAEAIAESYAAIEQPVIGVVRARVKRTIEDLIAAHTQRSMTVPAFHALCDRLGGIADPDLFLETLHHAGTVFHRPGFFNGEIILDQEWAIRAIYAVFDRASKTHAILQAHGGTFTRILLGLVWDEAYTPEEQALFLAMMQSCGICFEKLPGDPKAGTEASYLAPDLLPERRSDGGWDGDTPDQKQSRCYAHLPATLIRNILCAIGRKAGPRGDYWRHGVRINEAATRSEGLIVSDTGSGRLTLRTRAGDAAGLLATLVKIVEREEARLGVRPTAIEGGPGPRSASMPPQQDLTLDVQRLPSAEPGWFFSYATESENAGGRPVAAFCDKVKAATSITVRRDIDELRYGDQIEAFMDRLVSGERIFIWLTDAYLKSPYCMFELVGIWKRCNGNRGVFEDRIRVLLGDAAIRHETDLQQHREFWRAQQHAAYDRLQQATDCVQAALDLARIIEIVKSSADILMFIRERIRYSSFEEMTERELTRPPVQ
ncbi:COR domain-containing protein [Pararhodospirillum photometricum]|nr:COR domain-containing protein [Pararhodospirillum photometricum]